MTLSRRTPARKKKSTRYTQPQATPNIPQCLDAILNYMEVRDNVMMDSETGETITPEKPQAVYEFVMSTIGISEQQCNLLAAILDLSVGGTARPDNIARRLDISNLAFLSYKSELDDLVEKRIIRTTAGHGGSICYYVPDENIRQLQENRRPEPKDVSGLNPSAFIRLLNSLFHSFWKNDTDKDNLERDITDIIKANPGNSVVKGLREAGVLRLSGNEQILFLYMLVRSVIFREDTWGWECYGRLFEEIYDEDEIRCAIEEGNSPLFKNELIEYANEEGMADNQHICLTEKAVKDLLGELKSKEVADVAKSRDCIRSQDIASKTLYYNDEEQKQVSTLTSLLSPENYSNIVARLKEKNFRQGFNILLWGPAGTGKTETAYQIARQTGRDIFVVDLSQIKSKWVGDSEKNIRGLFQSYRQAVKNSDIAPILLFNEVDGIFAIRKSGAESAVDKMENTIQNIILQEMEDLEGILIATTNLTENLDRAFERRFLYKIHMRRPGTEAKTRIWESMVEGISETDAKCLAGEYDLSGGQIENISRKMTIDYVLTGNTMELDSIRELCRHEKLESGSECQSRTRVGF